MAKKKQGNSPRLIGVQGIAVQLREAIANSGQTAYALGLASDVDPGMIRRFVTGKCDIRLETAARIAHELGLRLADSNRRRGRAAKTPIETHAEVEVD